MKRFSFYAGVSGAVAAAAALVVAFADLSDLNRMGASVGVGLATLSGFGALVLKKRAMASDGLESVTTGMKTLALVMAIRAALLVAGLVWVARHEGAAGFVCGFFAVYLAQQWLEISYLLDAQKAHSQLRKMETR